MKKALGVIVISFMLTGGGVLAGNPGGDRCSDPVSGDTLDFGTIGSGTATISYQATTISNHWLMILFCAGGSPILLNELDSAWSYTFAADSGAYLFISANGESYSYGEDPIEATVRLLINGSEVASDSGIPGKVEGYLRFDGQGNPYLSDTSPTPPPPSPTPIPTPTTFSPIIDSGDYNGDSISDIAVFRPSSGLWVIRDITRAYFGANGDVPAPADYDGDGSTEIALFRASSGLWAVRGITRAYFGSSGDTAIPGDYDGSGTCGSAIFRPASGLWAIRGVTRAYFGSSSDRPVPVYASGRSMGKDIAIFRPGSGLWAVRGLSRTYFGASSDTPVAGNYTDYEGNLDIGIFRASSGLWAIKGNTRVYFGASGDIPVAGLAINPSTVLSQ